MAIEHERSQLLVDYTKNQEEKKQLLQSEQLNV